MKSRLSIQKRLMIPIVLLGIVALISNILSVYNIRRVNSNAAGIVDTQMAGAADLAEIRCSMLNIHKMALSHIVATDYRTMITVAAQIKEEEAALDVQLEHYKKYIKEDETAVYNKLMDNYKEFKHALVRLVCASADSRTQEAYACANDEVAVYGTAAEEQIVLLVEAIETRTSQAKQRLTDVYVSSIFITGIAFVSDLFLVAAAVCFILTYVV